MVLGRNTLIESRIFVAAQNLLDHYLLFSFNKMYPIFSISSSHIIDLWLTPDTEEYYLRNTTYIS